MKIYKILLPSEWHFLKETGQTSGAPIDVSDGYIHFSTAEQVCETAFKHFTKVPDLEVLICDSNAMRDDIKWETSRGGALFPHLYRNLMMSDVEWHTTVKLGAQGHVFPDMIP
jgi:uncharacterized protein (DUF952 family)